MLVANTRLLPRETPIFKRRLRYYGRDGASDDVGVGSNPFSSGAMRDARNIQGCSKGQHDREALTTGSMQLKCAEPHVRLTLEGFWNLLTFLAMRSGLVS